MLGKLARWLRILGFDCTHDAHVADPLLVRRAIEESRILLTRDRALTEDWRVGGVVLVRAERTFDQLAEVLRGLDLAGEIRLFRRCSRCNTALQRVPVGDVADLVPPDVASTQSEVGRCGRCGRLYWEGSHTRRMLRVVERLVAAA